MSTASEPNPDQQAPAPEDSTAASLTPHGEEFLHRARTVTVVAAVGCGAATFAIVFMFGYVATNNGPFTADNDDVVHLQNLCSSILRARWWSFLAIAGIRYLVVMIGGLGISVGSLLALAGVRSAYDVKLESKEVGSAALKSASPGVLLLTLATIILWVAVATSQQVQYTPLPEWCDTRDAAQRPAPEVAAQGPARESEVESSGDATAQSGAAIGNAGSGAGDRVGAGHGGGNGEEQ